MWSTTRFGGSKIVSLSSSRMNVIEKNANLIHKFAHNVRFGYELVNREFWVTNLSSAGYLVIL
jgi:hypothetical protein